MTGRVVRNLMRKRRPKIGYAQHLNEELGKFIRLRFQVLGHRQPDRILLEQLRVVMNHSDA
ncbi:hypothetical protein D3C74_439310 [compost metagenome]